MVSAVLLITKQPAPVPPSDHVVPRSVSAAQHQIIAVQESAIRVPATVVEPVLLPMGLAVRLGVDLLVIILTLEIAALRQDSVVQQKITAVQEIVSRALVIQIMEVRALTVNVDPCFKGIKLVPVLSLVLVVLRVVFVDRHQTIALV